MSDDVCIAYLCSRPSLCTFLGCPGVCVFGVGIGCVSDAMCVFGEGSGRVWKPEDEAFPTGSWGNHRSHWASKHTILGSQGGIL